MRELLALLEPYAGQRRSMSASDGKRVLRALARIGHLGGEVDLVALSGLEDSPARRLLGGDFERAWTLALGRLLRRLDAERIPAIGKQLRMSFTGGRERRRSAGPPDWCFALAALYSLNWNGFVREDAVHALRSCVDRGEDVDGALPFLLARLFDWVDPVAMLARDALLAAVPKASPAAIAKILPLVRRCGDPRRDRLGLAVMADVSGAVGARLDGAEGVALLRDGLGARSRAVRTECAVELLSHGAEGAHDELLTHADETIRLRYLGWLSQGHAVPGQMAQLLRLSEDRAPAVRAVALRAVAVQLGDAGAWGDVRERFLRALLDPKARSVRSIAQFHVGRREPGLSIGGFYRGAIADRRPGWRAAIDALSRLPHTEEEREADDALFLKLFDEPGPGTRGPVIRARAALERARLVGHPVPDPEFVKWLHSLLGDPRLEVRSATSKAIEALGCPPDLERLLGWAQELRARSGGAAADDRVGSCRDWVPLLRVSRALEAWPRLTFLMSVPLEEDLAIRDRVEVELHGWLSLAGGPHYRFYGTGGWQFPSLAAADEETLLFVEGRLGAVGDVLDDGVVRAIRWALEQPPRGSVASGPS